MNTQKDILDTESQEETGGETLSLVPRAEQSTSFLSGRDESKTGSIPWYTGTLMLGHLAVTLDRDQHRRWRDKLEGIRMLNALEHTRGHKTRALLRKPKVWKMVRRTVKTSATLQVAASAGWLLLLIPAYASMFGWLAALTFLLPVPVAWKVACRLYESATIRSLSDAHHRRSWLTKIQNSAANTSRVFTAGFGFGFTLLFLQGIISWFMTPAPSIWIELFLDIYYASIAGTLSGSIAIAFSPMITVTTRKILKQAPFLLEGERRNFPNNASY